MPDLYFYSSAPALTVTLDSGQTLEGARCTHKDREAYLVSVPAGATGGMRVSTPGFTWADSQRGLLVLPTDGNPECTFALDDIYGSETPTPGPEPPPVDPNADPLAIITAVYEQGDFDLETKDGNGQFTEAACTALHEQHSPHWGHIAKSGAQNQYNGHAVDAIMTLYPIGETAAGGYDIILNSVSPDAEPTFHYAGGPDPNLWYYPAAAAETAALTTELVDVSDEIQDKLRKVKGGEDLAIELLEVVDRLVRRRATPGPV